MFYRHRRLHQEIHQRCPHTGLKSAESSRMYYGNEIYRNTHITKPDYTTFTNVSNVEFLNMLLMLMFR